MDCNYFGLTVAQGAALAASMLDFAKTLTVPMGNLDKFILPDDHARVVQELQRRKGLNNSKPAKEGWRAKHKSFLASKGISWRTLSAPPDTQASEWFQLAPEREQEVIMYGIATTQGTLTAIDTSQNMDRSPPICTKCLPTFTTGSQLFMMHCNKKKPLNRFLLGSEALALQGFPTSYLSVADGWVPSEAQMLNLAGNAFTSTACAAVIAGVFARLPSSIGSGIEAPLAIGEADDEMVLQDVLDFMKDL